MNSGGRIPELKGKGLFVFSDPGGAKPILALAKANINNLSEVLIISDRKYEFYDIFNLKVNNADELPYQILTSFRPNFVITGTSYTSKIELDFINISNQFKIPTFSFVDHWTAVFERFRYGENIILPQKILVVDERAKTLLINQEVCSKKIIVFGNPYHKYLKKWKPTISKKDFFNKIGIYDINKKIILYAPDPLSNIDGKKIYGFDEIDTTIELQNILYSLLDKYQFILNPHPNQDFNKINKIIDSRIILLDKGIDVNHLIYYSDLVIGMFSNILIEATIMNKKVIRFFKNSKSIDPLCGEIGKLVFPETLFVNFQKFI
jgi:hypothetical protein